MLLKVWVHVGGLGGWGWWGGGQTSVNYLSLVCCYCVLSDLSIDGSLYMYALF